MVVSVVKQNICLKFLRVMSKRVKSRLIAAWVRGLNGHPAVIIVTVSRLVNEQFYKTQASGVNQTAVCSVHISDHFHTFSVEFRQNSVKFRLFLAEFRVKIGCQNWPSTFRVKIPPKLAVKNLVVKIGRQNWSSKLAIKIGRQNWPSKFPLKSEKWDSTPFEYSSCPPWLYKMPNMAESPVMRV